MADSDTMECTNCGYTCLRRDLEWKQPQKTRYNCEPADDCENWYETICPECGKIETMERVEENALNKETPYE